MDGVVSRFWSKVNVGDPDECWGWTAARDKQGYGAFNLDGMKIAHRVSFFLHHGRWPTPCCLHSCDNRACVNPAHLREGTYGDNNHDTYNRNRREPPRHTGSKNGNSKLTRKEVDMILNAYAKGNKSQNEIATDHGITQGHVSRIVRGASWG